MQGIQLLIVEDDAAIRESVAGFLGESTYDVTCAATGNQALTALQQSEFDLILLDLGLPDIHGMQVLREVALRQPGCRVLVMTALEDIAAKVAVLETGGDDYLVKPFSLEELGARIQALLRRSKKQVTPALTIGDTCIFRGAPLVQREGTRVQLSPMEHRLLMFLVEAGGRVVSRSELLDEVWDGADRYPNTVDVHIESLRKKIDTPFKRKTIKTAYRQGYYYQA